MLINGAKAEDMADYLVDIEINRMASADSQAVRKRAKEVVETLERYRDFIGEKLERQK